MSNNVNLIIKINKSLNEHNNEYVINFLRKIYIYKGYILLCLSIYKCQHK